VNATFEKLVNATLKEMEVINSEEKLKKAYEMMEAVKDYLSQHTYHLQNYEVSAYMETIRSMESKYQQMKDKLPKKQFHFKNLKKTVNTEVKEEEKVKEKDDLKINLSESDISITKLADGKTEVKKDNKDNCYCYIGENVKSKISVDKDISIKQLYCKKNKDCVMEVGTVLGSALIYDCTDCIFRISAHQVRIHNCTNCSFKLFSNSGPVIEHSQNLTFQRIKEEFISEIYKGKVNHCEEVMDFNWQKKEKSPNWLFIPDTE
jgi:hypothetical protein